jgi:hypothetical protein
MISFSDRSLPNLAAFSTTLYRKRLAEEVGRYNRGERARADVAKLADAPDLGSGSRKGV